MPEDLHWLIGLLDEDHVIRPAVAGLLRGVFLQSDTFSLDLLLDEARRHPELADAVRDLISPVPLGHLNARTHSA